MIQKIDKITEELDRILATLGLIFALIITIVLVLFLPETAYRYIEAPIMLFLACVVYLLIRKRIYEMGGLPHLEELHANRSIILILNILFVSLFSYSIFSVATRPELYSRPLGYFIATSLIVAVLAIEILFRPDMKEYTSFILLKIMLVALGLRWTLHWIFPDLIGIDPWWHQMFTMQILELGYIPDGYAYSKLPVMHLIIGSTSLITGLGYKLSSISSISFLQVVSLIFIFLLGRLIYTEKIGLLAALLLGIADIQIKYGIIISPITVGAILMPILLYAIFKARQDRLIILIYIFFIMCMVLIVTHALAALGVAMFLFLFFLASEIYKKVYHVKFNVPITLVSAIFFTVAMYAWWIYVAEHYIVAIGSLIKEGFLTTTGGFAIQAQTHSTKDVLEVLLSVFGFFLNVGLSITGSFYMLSKKFVNGHGFSLAICGYAFLAIIFFSLIMGMVGLLPGRWYLILQIIIAIPAAIGLFLICTIFKKKLEKTLILIILIIVLSFFMITDPCANMDNPIYSKNTTNCLAFTDSELIAITTISNIKEDRMIWIDQYPRYYLKYTKNITSRSVTPQLLSKDFTSSSGEIIVIREEIVKSPFGAYESGVIKIEYDPRTLLDEQRFNRIYDSKSVSAFLKED